MAEKQTQEAQVKKAAPAKKKVKKNVVVGICYIQAGFGNIIVTLTDPAGNAIAWSSGGLMGFKGSRKGTPYAAQVTAEDACKKAAEHGLKSVNVLVALVQVVRLQFAPSDQWESKLYQLKIQLRFHITVADHLRDVEFNRKSLILTTAAILQPESCLKKQRSNQNARTLL